MSARQYLLDLDYLEDALDDGGRAEELIAQGLMHEAGIRALERWRSQ